MNDQKMDDQKNDLKEITMLWGELCDLQTRFACALKNAHFLFSWYTECSSTIANNSELDALFSVIDHMDVLNQSFYDFNDDMSYYLHEKGTEGEAWEKAEKVNQQREGYAPKN